MYKKVFIFTAIIFLAIFIGTLSKSGTVSAAEDTPIQKCLKSDGEWRSVDGGGTEFCDCPANSELVAATCSKAEPQNDVSPGSTDEDVQKILGYLQTGINLVTAMAGLAITAGFIIGGIQYSTSGGNPNAAAAAKKRIGNAVLALLALVFLYTFLQWLVPGGIFG